jgi:hypothetical protein
MEEERRVRFDEIETLGVPGAKPRKR